MGPECQLEACPSGCKGNGACMPGGLCKCFPGWRGADCGTPRCAEASGRESPALKSLMQKSNRKLQTPKSLEQKSRRKLQALKSLEQTSRRKFQALKSP